MKKTKEKPVKKMKQSNVFDSWVVSFLHIDKKDEKCSPTKND